MAALWSHIELTVLYRAVVQKKAFTLISGLNIRGKYKGRVEYDPNAAPGLIVINSVFWILLYYNNKRLIRTFKQ